MVKQQSIKALIENKREIKVENVPKVDRKMKNCATPKKKFRKPELLAFGIKA